jgi:hypothetical protein
MTKNARFFGLGLIAAMLASSFAYAENGQSFTRIKAAVSQNNWKTEFTNHDTNATDSGEADYKAVAVSLSHMFSNKWFVDGTVKLGDDAEHDFGVSGGKKMPFTRDEMSLTVGKQFEEGWSAFFVYQTSETTRAYSTGGENKTEAKGFGAGVAKATPIWLGALSASVALVRQSGDVTISGAANSNEELEAATALSATVGYSLPVSSAFVVGLEYKTQRYDLTRPDGPFSYEDQVNSLGLSLAYQF